MRYDFTPLFRSTVGFDQVGRLLDAALTAQDSAPNYPPYDIERTDENAYRITMAIAGFGQKDLEITQQDNVLTVKGERPQPEADGVLYLHRGIAARSFERRFTLAEYVNVKAASVENGLLIVELQRELPEAKRPRTIAINGSGPQRLVKKAA